VIFRQSLAFWAAAEQESRYASEDPDVDIVRRQLGLSPSVKVEEGDDDDDDDDDDSERPGTEGRPRERDKLAAWIESALAPPTLPTQQR
jgi:hypothetical protein